MQIGSSNGLDLLQLNQQQQFSAASANLSQSTSQQGLLSEDDLDELSPSLGAIITSNQNAQLLNTSGTSSTNSFYDLIGSSNEQKVLGLTADLFA